MSIDDYRNDQLNDYLAGLEEAENETDEEDEESENLRQTNNRTRSH